MFLFDMTQHLFFTVITGSLATLAVISVLLVLGSIYACVMEWADDNEKDYNNPMWSFLLKMTSLYRINDIFVDEAGGLEHYKYGLTTNKKYEGHSYADLSAPERSKAETVLPYGAFVFGLILLVFVGPLAILVMLWIYPVTLTCLTLLALAHLLRFCKRLSKKFTKHTVDPNAHKEEVEQ